MEINYPYLKLLHRIVVEKFGCQNDPKTLVVPGNCPCKSPLMQPHPWRLDSAWLFPVPGSHPKARHGRGVCLWMSSQACLSKKHMFTLLSSHRLQEGVYELCGMSICVLSLLQNLSQDIECHLTCGEGTWACVQDCEIPIRCSETTHLPQLRTCI